MNETLKTRLDRAIAERPILEHPFYQAWAEGTLTKDDLKSYAGQYWTQVEAFPGYLDEIETRITEPSARAIVQANLADERDGDHAGLWLRFADALGADTEEVRATSVEPETSRCVESFRRAATSSSVPFALGMIYGYESQTPGVASTKIAGLRDHYGITGNAVTYFELHGELDVEHSDELLNALDAVIDDDSDVAEAVDGARAGAAAVWGLLDGVERVRGQKVAS